MNLQHGGADERLAYWRVDGQGNLVEPASVPGCPGWLLPAGPLSAVLTPAYRVLWELTIWPALRQLATVSEVVLEVPGDKGSVQLLTFWRASDAPGDRSYSAIVVPGTKRAQLLQQLRLAQDSLDVMPGAILQLSRGNDGNLHCPYASGQLLDLLGVTRSRLMHSAALLFDSLVEPSRQLLQASLELAECDSTRSWSVVLQPRRQPQRRIELAARRELPLGSWHCVLTDVSERERLVLELKQRADTDDLTALPNRSGLLALLAARLQSGRRLAVLFMDCDRFKQINDSLGHDMGDQVLRLVARRLREGLRSSDVLGTVPALAEPGPVCVAGRLGGDEFVVIADGVQDAAEATALADRLVQALAEPFAVNGYELVLTASVGVVLADAQSQPEALLRDADTAMYEAKRGGRSRWVLFEPAMQQRVTAAITLERQLRRALALGHVYPMFQPIVEVDSGRIACFEALARWRDPERGFISPAQFIPVAEDSGQIAALGESILRQACREFMRWRGLGLAPQGLRMSVNLSRAQLNDPGLPRRVQRLLDELGMPHQALQLEVTESMAMAEDGSLQVLSQLHELGCRLSLDDFGTGYSSLAALHRLPVQQVKLDRSFVSEVETSPYHLAVVKATLQVAQALALEVIAEGVETHAQACALQALGCHWVQGWVYSKAVEADEAARLLRSARIVPRTAN